LQVLTSKLLERSPQDEIQRAFTLFDLQQTGRITVQELGLIARQLQVRRAVSTKQPHSVKATAPARLSMPSLVT
jgi:Ca2+-binding EF-hand superfamily protein